MDTLKIAFDTVIIGALALPWVLLVLELFLQPEEKFLLRTLQFAKDNQLYTVAAVLLFAIAYVMGAAMSRLAGDLFNDDDFGISVTEDAIRYQIYCNESQGWLIELGVCQKAEQGKAAASAPTAKEGNQEKDLFALAAAPKGPEEDSAAARRLRRLFELQESALLLQGQEKTSRMQHIHQQLLVVRGCALNGVILSLLFLFGFLAKQKAWGRWALAVVSVALLGLAVFALHNHFRDARAQQYLIEPPLMEMSLMIVVLTGAALIRKGAADRPYGIGFLVSLMLTCVAYAGWWWTEIVYDELVLNFFNARHQGLLPGG